MNSLVTHKKWREKKIPKMIGIFSDTPKDIEAVKTYLDVINTRTFLKFAEACIMISDNVLDAMMTHDAIDCQCLALIVMIKEIEKIYGSEYDGMMKKIFQIGREIHKYISLDGTKLHFVSINEQGNHVIVMM